ncbi:PQQ-binding-like beta-propeller repeat protein [Akkermansiaceae bacterium]|jgi:outer membrane protein assembly factor BamB|nr:PQQ-binding-like beta-propeller repeat protein [Akkermansiaceae bacterium]
MKYGFLLSFLLTLSPFAQDTWPRFRGEGATGVSDAKIPTELGEKSLLWSTKLPGPGSSSPVIWKDKLFVTSENRDKKTIALVCLDTKSGKTAWSKPLAVGNYHLHRFNNTAAASPAVNDKAVVVCWFNGTEDKAMLTAFDHSGSKLWDYEIGGVETQHGFNLQPVIHHDQVVLAHIHMADGFVGTVSLKTGKSTWKKKLKGNGEKTSYITPLIRKTANGHEVVVASHAHGVFALDFASGKETWSLPDTMKQRTIVSPIDVLAGSDSTNSLIAAGCKSGVYFTVRPPSKKGEAAKIAWRMKGKTPYVPTPVSDGQTVFALSDGGVLTALEAKSGKVKWTQQMQANFYASPIIADGKLLALSREGEMITADVSDGYREVSRCSLSPGPESEWSDATPAIAHGNIYVRLGSRIDCHGKK